MIDPNGDNEEVSLDTSTENSIENVSNALDEIMDTAKRWSNEYGFTILVAIGGYDQLDMDSDMSMGYYGNYFMALGMASEIPMIMRNLGTNGTTDDEE